MKYAICILPLAQVRLAADHRAEMVNQLLFGESIKIISMDDDGWLEAESVMDGYKGYCKLNQFLLLDNLITERKEYTAGWVEEISVNNEKLMIPFGSNLSILKANLPGLQLAYTGQIFSAGNKADNGKAINEISRMFLNSTYLWGGRSVFGIDCSGFVQSVFKLLNIVLPRDANMQAETGESVGFLQETKCGDLAFFDEEGEITHVGILLNEHEIIHASGNVRIDKIDNEGIINSTTQKRTHRLRIIKRVI